MTKIIPKVQFVPLSLEENIELVSLAFSEHDSLFEQQKLILETFPQFSGLSVDELEKEEVHRIITTIVAEDYSKTIALVEQAVENNQKLWDQYNDQFMSTLFNILNFDWDEKNPYIKCYIGNYPIGRRSNTNQTITYNYKKYGDSLIKGIAHECTHLLYFSKCNAESPELADSSEVTAWQLSEMMIDPILNSPEIKEVFGNRGDLAISAYPVFYTADNVGIMEHIKDLYQSQPIEIALQEGYNYLSENPITVSESFHR